METSRRGSEANGCDVAAGDSRTEATRRAPAARRYERQSRGGDPQSRHDEDETHYAEAEARWVNRETRQVSAEANRCEGAAAHRDRATGQVQDGTRDAAWKPSPLFIVELNGTRNVGRLPQGDFTQQVVGSRFRLNVSPDLQLNSYVQYDDDSRLVGTNTRLRWTFSPVGDLFVVYNHNVRELLDSFLVRRGYGFDSNRLLVKLQYAFRY